MYVRFGRLHLMLPKMESYLRKDHLLNLKVKILIFFNFFNYCLIFLLLNLKNDDFSLKFYNKLLNNLIFLHF